MFGIGFPELIIIIIVALIVLGPAKLPEVARSLGKAIKDFKHLAEDVKQSIEDDVPEERGPEEKSSKDNEQPCTKQEKS